MKKILLLFFIASAAVGCAAKMNMEIISPAGNSNIGDYKNIAVWDVSLREPYANYTDVFEDTLSGIVFGEEPVFNVKKDKYIIKMRQDIQLNPNDTASVINTAKSLDVQALWFGVLSEDYFEEDFKQTKNSCEESKPGGPDDHCGSYIAFCTSKQLVVNAEFFLIESEVGAKVYSEILSGSAKSEVCSDSDDVVTLEDLRDESIKKIADKFRRQVAPYKENVKVGIMTGSKGINDIASIELFDNGVGFAQEGRMDKACASWTKAYEKNPYAYGLMYNIALCKEVDGQYEEAIKLLEELDKILPPASFTNKLNYWFKVQDLPNSMVQSSITRNKKHIADRALLKEQVK